MTVGFEVHNANNKLQVTDRFYNIRLVARKAIMLNTDFTEISTGEDELIAFRALNNTNTPVALWSVSKDTAVFKKTGSSTVMLVYYRFKHTDIPAGDCFEVRNASDEVVFSDNARFMKIINSINGVWDGRSNYTTETIIPAGVTAAVLHGARYRESISTVFGDGGWGSIVSFNYFGQQFIFNGDRIKTVYANEYKWEYGSPVPAPDSPVISTYKIVPYNFLVLDVSLLDA